MGTEVSKVGMSESESLWPRFARAIKRKGKKQSYKPTAFSNYAVDISPTCLMSVQSKALARISRDGELIPVVLSPVGKAISSERQPIEKKKQLGFGAAEIKVKSCEPEVGTEELAAKQISEDRRSWVRIAKAFRFPKVSKTPVIEQHRAQEIRQQKKTADSIPGPIEQPSKSSHTSAAVDSKSNKLWKFINFHRKASSYANKSREIKSSPLSQLPRADMNSSSQPKKLKMSAERKGSITGDATGEGEGYSMAINLAVFIVIMACLVLFSNRLLAIVCTSIWWYLLPSLLKINRASAAAGGANSGSSDLKYQRQRKFK